MQPHVRYLRDLMKTMPDQVSADDVLTELCNSVDALAREFGVLPNEDLAKISLVMKLWGQISDRIHAEFPKAAIENSALPHERHKRVVIYFQPEARCGFGIAWHGTRFNGLYWGIFRRHAWDDTADIALKLSILFDGRRPTADCPWWKWAFPTDDVLPIPINWGNDFQPWREILTGAFSERLVSVARSYRAIVHDPSIL